MSLGPDPWLAELTGAASSAPVPPAIINAGEGGKFTLDGQVLQFPGNTFICHIDPTSKAHEALKALQDGIRTGPGGPYFTYLPPTSFHMTVFPAICGDPLGQDGWPEAIEKGAELGEVTDIFQSRLKGKTGFSDCRISPVELRAGYSLTVEGKSAGDKAKLLAAREMLQEATSLYRPDFDSYFFHITLCYRLKWMPDDVAQAHLTHAAALYSQYKAELMDIQLGPIEFCVFDTMFEFQKLQILPAV